MIFQTSMIMFHVNLQECIWTSTVKWIPNTLFSEVATVGRETCQAADFPWENDGCNGHLKVHGNVLGNRDSKWHVSYVYLYNQGPMKQFLGNDRICNPSCYLLSKSPPVSWTSMTYWLNLREINRNTDLGPYFVVLIFQTFQQLLVGAQPSPCRSFAHH